MDMVEGLVTLAAGCLTFPSLQECHLKPAAAFLVVGVGVVLAITEKGMWDTRRHLIEHAAVDHVRTLSLSLSPSLSLSLFLSLPPKSIGLYKFFYATLYQWFTVNFHFSLQLFDLPSLTHTLEAWGRVTRSQNTTSFVKYGKRTKLLGRRVETAWGGT